MTTHLRLHHLGEVIVCALLEQLRDQLASVTCAASGLSIADSFAKSGLEAPFAFQSEASPVRIHGSAGGVWPLDGMHRVDVLATGNTGTGVGFEAKLGLDRLTPQEIGKRFQARCFLSRHRPPRLNGSMIAVLERRFPFRCERIVCGRDEGVCLATDWWLVLRRRVWQNCRDALHCQLKNGRILVFEDAVDRAGGQQHFDALVTRLVGGEFYRAWQLSD